MDGYVLLNGFSVIGASALAIWTLVKIRSNGNGNGNGHANGAHAAMPVETSPTSSARLESNLERLVAELHEGSRLQAEQIALWEEAADEPEEAPLPDLPAELNRIAERLESGLNSIVENLHESSRLQTDQLMSFWAERLDEAPAADPGLTDLAGQLDRIIAQAENWQVKAISSQAEIARQLERISQAEAERHRENAETLVANLDRISGELRSGFEGFSWQLGDLVAAERNRTKHTPVAPLKAVAEGTSAGEPASAGGGGGGDRPAPHVEPPRPKAPNISLAMFNTWTLDTGNVYILVPPEAGIYALGLFNLGTLGGGKDGRVYVRADADPSPGDPQSYTVPPWEQEVRFSIPGELRIAVDTDSTVVSARVVHQ